MKTGLLIPGMGSDSDLKEPGPVFACDKETLICSIPGDTVQDIRLLRTLFPGKDICQFNISQNLA
jgi:hypothetical protein